MSQNLALDIEAGLKPTVIAMGYVWWGSELIRSGTHCLLRIYIDCEGGVTVDDCALVSQQVSAILNVEDWLKGDYQLEISSPGLDRILFELDQFEQFIGEWVSFKLKAPLNGRRKFKARLKSVSGDQLSFEIEDKSEVKELVLPYSNIEKARLIPDYE